jgi:hypothetical protein
MTRPWVLSGRFGGREREWKTDRERAEGKERKKTRRGAERGRGRERATTADQP